MVAGFPATFSFLGSDMTLQERVRQEWAMMLRSGEYHQCGYFLRTSISYSYCALDLLVEAACRVTGRDFWTPKFVDCFGCSDKKAP